MAEYYKRVPLDLYENLMFRRDMMVRCGKDVGFRQGMMQACAEDPLFFFNAFCWVYEPRPRFNNGVRLPTQVPFISWEHQIPAILQIAENIGQCDIGVEKSRGEGMSWMGVLLACHDWLFSPMTAIGLVSKDENSVDDPNDPDSLMWKCDFTLKKLPNWMSGELGKDYKRDVTKHVLRNLRNESTISGYSATGNVASGGRKKWFLKDELAKFPRPADKHAMASTQHVTECRLIVSTPLGNSGAYYDAMHEPSNMVKIVLDWKQNPTRNRGLYKWEKGMPVAVDPENNPLPDNYKNVDQDVLDIISRLRRKGFTIEGKVRSPWYDRECDRAGATPQNIAQELDRDYGGSAYRIFGDSFVEKGMDAIAAPVLEGDIDFKQEDLEQVRFDEIEGAPCKLWFPLSSIQKPPQSNYVVGCDVSSGTGGSYTSNSTMIAFDMRTGEQVLEYASNTIAPTMFADLAIAVSKWMFDAYLAWEHNGPGASFTKQVLNRHYDNIYYRKSQSRRGRRSSKEAGWWTDEKTKEVMFGEFQSAVLMNEICVRSKELLTECSRYVRKEGRISHALTKDAADDSKGVSHGDRTIAACVALQAMKDRPSLTEASLDVDIAPLGTMARRLQDFEDSKKDTADGWDYGLQGAAW
jgi:hypothetical protein